MREVELVKTSSGKLAGTSPENHDRYQRMKHFMEALEPGEIFRIRYWQDPDYRLHKKLFALLRLAFNHWDPEANRKRLTYKGMPIEKNFDQFRRDILILAGFYEQFYDLQGRMHLEAKSLAFDKMDDEEKERVLDSVVNVVLKHVFTNYTRDDLDAVIAEITRFGSDPQG